MANAYKHAGPLRSKHPVASESNILAAGAGYGIDGSGIGKFGGVEVLVTERGGSVRKLLGDVPWAICRMVSISCGTGHDIAARRVARLWALRKGCRSRRSGVRLTALNL